MRMLFSSVVLLEALLFAELASAHGIPLAVDANEQHQLFAPTLVTYREHDSLLAPFPENAPLLVSGTIGFYPVFDGGIPAGTVLTVDASGSTKHPAALAYWDGANVLPSPVTASLSRSSFSVDVLPTDTLVAGGPLGAYSGEVGGHSSITLALPLDAPTGLYAVGFQVTAPGFERSETFWAVANNGLAPERALAGVRAIGSVVPEPSAWALASVAALLIGVARRRSKSRSAR